MDNKLKAFLDLISFSEGTCLSPLTKDDGYDVIVSGVHGPSVFTDSSKHPFEDGGSVTVRTGPPALISTAAGRYQLLARFWRVYRAQLHLQDYSPESQDAVAIQQIRERKALSMIEAGNIEGAIAACANIWASFPGNGYGQGGKSMATLVAKYNELLAAEPATVAA
jgi:muramidase (phage lysozyme)